MLPLNAVSDPKLCENNTVEFFSKKFEVTKYIVALLAAVLFATTLLEKRCYCNTFRGACSDVYIWYPGVYKFWHPMVLH